MSSMPDPLQNLYRDLRDRRMLPLVALLLVAIVAVPLLLSDGEQAPPPTSEVSSADAATGLEGAEIADPVVLTEVPGFRNYRERLSDLQKKNPFRQQFTGTPKAVKKLEQKAKQEAKEAAQGAGGAGGDTGGGVATATDDGTSGDAGTGTDTGSGGSTGGGTTTYVLSWEIDAKIKVGGKKDQEEKGVKQLEFVPGESHPVLQFIEGDIDETYGVFLVSRSVGDTKGDGKCAPRSNDCQFVRLHVGDARSFEYEPNGLTYKIKLTGVHLKRKKVDPEDPGATQDSFFSQAGG